ncbi:phage scaffolding protein [Eubacterium barkeri]|uniref:Phage minor structural protein GP20 n=1 Tax=Eubacterium barkeri TaxID=1528 RepID=A0A1H3HDS6_EUBBA|nr:phage scaffolding protein [Eubacterium barkeri]SDY13375.1 Phage minor structural protein GP20 [Eubacterium barkeri]
MNTEEFRALGLDEAVAKKAAEASKKELEGYIPKNRFEEVNTAKKQLEKDLKDRDGQLDELKKNAGDNEALKQQIEVLQGDNQKKDEDYQKQIRELAITNAVKLAISETAQDVDLVASLLDTDKIILSADGSITGIDEQVKALKESKTFLFKEEDSNQNPQAGFQFGGDGKGSQTAPAQKSIKDAIAEHYKQG